MRASCLVLVGWLAVATSAAAAPADDAIAAYGDGLAPTLPRLQGRVRLGMSASTLDLSPLAAAGADARVNLSGASVLGDYYFGNRVATRDGDVAGFRATTGVYVGSRAGLWGGPASFAPGTAALIVERQSFSLAAPAWIDDATNNDRASSTVPYIGLGYSSGSLKGGFSYSADLGLMALNPGNALRLGRAFGNVQSLDDLLRDLRFAPVVQVGVSYSF